MTFFLLESINNVFERIVASLFLGSKTVNNSGASKSYHFLCYTNKMIRVLLPYTKALGLHCSNLIPILNDGFQYVRVICPGTPDGN